jgi:Cohesin domain
MKSNVYISIGLLYLCSVLIGVLPHSTYAADASLFLTPRTGVFPIGEEFSVTVRIDTGGTPIGSADVTVGYDPNDLTFVSYATEGSVFSSIIKDEDGSKYGKVRLQGIVSTNRGPFTGGEGLFATLTFRPLRNAATQVWFAEGSASPLVASLGELVSNILSAPLQSATYTLVPKDVVPAATAGAVGYVQQGVSGGGIEITPLPVPEDEWFSTTTVKLSWTIPEGATDMKTGLSTDPNGAATKVYPVPLSSVTLDAVPVGANYFHLQFKKGEGWGNVTHFPIKVDRSPPEYVAVTEAPRDDPTDPRIVFVIEAGDPQSGIARYEIGKDGAPGEKWDRPEDGKYRPEGLEPGEHTLTVTAFNKAGVGTSTDTVFLVKSIESPTLTSAPDRVLTGDAITVQGTTYPNATVTVFTSLNDGEADESTVKSDASGAFTATLTDGARAGKYTVWFSVTDERGAVSPISIKRSVTASQPYIMLFGTMAVTYLSVIVPLVALILLLALVVWLGYTWIRGYRTRVRRETGEAFDVTHEEFEHLRADLVKQIGMLEKANQSRELTREEMHIFQDLSRRLDAMESHISEEIDDIERVPSRGGVAGTVGHNRLGAYQPKGVDLTPHAPPYQYQTDAHTVRIQPRG